MRTENRYNYAKNQATYDARKLIQEKIQAKRLKSQQSEKNLARNPRSTINNDNGALPTSTRSEDNEKPNNKKYFRREKPDLKVKTSISQDGRSRADDSVSKTK